MGAKKCPPGVICFESMTLLLIVILGGFVIYHNIYLPMQQKSKKEIVYIPPTRILHQNYHSNIPTTVSTQRMETQYRQVGILTRHGSSNIILPLYGRMINTSRSKWQYYTINDSNNHVRLPISVKGRNASDEYGVDEVYSGDNVYVQGHDTIFTATIYENNRYVYNPF